jgi:hypothetical protein
MPVTPVRAWILQSGVAATLAVVAAQVSASGAVADEALLAAGALVLVASGAALSIFSDRGNRRAGR